MRSLYCGPKELVKKAGSTLIGKHRLNRTYYFGLNNSRTIVVSAIVNCTHVALLAVDALLRKNST
jgi:hypothetical protein